MLAQKQRARTSGGALAYVDEGDGPAVVLLHGFPLCSFVWRDLIALLSARFRVIAPDLLGCGDSDKPPDAPLHIRAQAGYVRELVAVLGIKRFAVVGETHGGGIAQLLALDGPGVEAMVLLNTICFDVWPAGLLPDVGASSPETGPMVQSAIHAALDLGIGHRERITDAHVREYARPFASDPPAFFRLIRSLDGLGLVGREDELGALEAPVLILWGEDDAFLPAEVAERLSEAIPTSTLGLLPGCGHLLMEDAAETVAPMIYEYLRARYLKAPHGHEGIVTIQLERKPPWIDEEGA